MCFPGMEVEHIHLSRAAISLDGDIVEQFTSAVPPVVGHPVGFGDKCRCGPPFPAMTYNLTRVIFGDEWLTSGEHNKATAPLSDEGFTLNILHASIDAPCPASEFPFDTFQIYVEKLSL